jgi:hypothetical protein
MNRLEGVAMSYRFAHENLDCYRLAVEVANWFSEPAFREIAPS